MIETPVLSLTRPIRILQLNAQRKKDTITSILNLHAKEFDIVILQEPAWGFIGKADGKDINGPIGHSGWLPIIPTTNLTNTNTRPRTMTYYQRRPDYTINLRTDILEDRDIQIIDIKQTNQPTTTIINVYNDTSGLKGNCILKKLIQTEVPNDHPTIITGDFNLHHELWSAGPVGNNNMTDEIVDWLSRNGFSIMNTKGEITHPQRNNREKASVIDLTFINGKTASSGILQDWAIDPSLAHDSDHYAIKFILNQEQTEIQNISGTKYSLKDAKIQDWIERIEVNLKDSADSYRRLEETQLPTEELIDRCESDLSEAILATITQIGKEKRPSTFSKPWWDKDLTEAAERVAKARIEQKNLTHITGQEQRGLIRKRIKKARNYFKSLCKFKKREWATNTLESASSGEIWSFQNWSKGTRNYPSPPISRGEGQPKAIDHQDKCEALRKELFQPPPTLNTTFDVNLNVRNPAELTFSPITSSEIDEAITGASVKSAPGFTQITYQAIKWTWQSETGRKRITSLLGKCLTAGYHPIAWRKAIAIALKKPNKPDYSNPRAYRLITLLESLGKVLEKVIAKRLTFLAGKFDLVPGNQFGGRAHSSTSDAIMAFINDVHSAWNHGKVTSALTFDIKGYFDFVNHNRLLAELKRKRLPLEYVKWTASFLKDREAAVCIDGIRGEMKKVENGIPQGSPISPILAAFYTAELLDDFNKRANNPITTTPLPDNPTEPHLYMYVDDGKIFVSSESLDTNVRILKSTYTKVEKWLHKAGLAPDHTKRELMHYTRRKTDKSPSIEFVDTDGIARTVKPESTVRWLGVHFDRKLLFNQHARLMAARGENAVVGLTMLANTIRGLHQVQIRRLYLSCVIPKILYAAPAWFSGTKTQTRPLEKVQRRALCLMCAAFRTTPTEAMEIEASIPPIRIQVQLQTRRYAVRLNKLPLTNPVVQRLPDAWRNNEPPTLKPPLPTANIKQKKHKVKTSPLIELTKYTDPKHERIHPYLTPPWRRTADSFNGRVKINPSITDPNKGDETDKEKSKAEDIHKKLLSDISLSETNLIIYSDGSLIKKNGFTRTGASAVLYRQNREVKSTQLGLGGRAEVYDGELAGLLIGAKEAIRYQKDNPTIKHLHFFADNSAAVRAIFNPNNKAGQHYSYHFHQKLCKFLDSDLTNRLSISWCPSHTDIEGNEKADKLAKEATSLAGNGPITTSRSNALRRAKLVTIRTWRKQWEKNPKGGSFAIANRLQPSLTLTKRFQNNPREVFGA